MSYEADYVVVGAGAGGAVVAARLAEDGTRSVILIEAGPDNTADPTVAAGAKFVFLYDVPPPVGPSPSPSHWGFTSRQNGKTYSYPRGTGLGGSTNHHALVDGRGSPKIWDQIAEELDDEVWSYQRLLPLFMKMENFDIPYVDERVHGKNGWLHIKRANLEKGFHPELVNVAMRDIGMPFRHDFYNDPANYAGVGWTDMQMHPDGRRSNAAVDLLLPTLEKTRKNGWNNLQILTDKLAARVLFEANRAVGVEVLEQSRAYKADVVPAGRAGNTITIKAKREVILCGGSFNTPQLLMLSGIGAEAQLKQYGIPLVKDLPGVGRHLQDHTEVGHIYEMKNLPDKLFRWQNTFLSQHLPQYAPLADPSAFTENYIPLIMDWFSGYDEADAMHPDLHIHVATVFFRDFNLNPDKFKDADPNRASYFNQFLTQVDAAKPRAYHTFLIECVKPSVTKGQVKLRSADPTEPVEVDMRLYEADADLTRLAMGVQLGRKMMSHPDIQTYGPEEINPGPHVKTLEQLKDFLAKYSAFGHHCAGTAKMGKASDPMAVLDSRLRVLGIEGLRVADASVFPHLPSYNTSRPSYVVGELAAQLIVS
jgi:choline dehydrogenase